MFTALRGGEEGEGLDHDIMSGAINWDQAGGEGRGAGGEHCNYQIDVAVQDHQYLLQQSKQAGNHYHIKLKSININCQ